MWILIWSILCIISKNKQKTCFLLFFKSPRTQLHIYSLLLYIGNDGTFSLDAIQSSDIETCNITPQGKLCPERISDTYCKTWERQVIRTEKVLKMKNGSTSSDITGMTLVRTCQSVSILLANHLVGKSVHPIYVNKIKSGLSSTVVSLHCNGNNMQFVIN